MSTIPWACPAIKARAFHTMELLTLWSVAFNGMLGTLVRLAMPTTMYVRPLWVGVDCVEVGTCAAISLARILEARGLCRLEG